MLPWILVSLLVLAAAVLVTTRQPAQLRRRGFMLIGAALVIAIAVELLIRTDTISVSGGSEMMTLAVIFLAGFAIWRLPGADRGAGG